MAEKEFGVISQAKNLAEHTFRLTSNCNRYPKKYRFSLVDKEKIITKILKEVLHEEDK